LIFIPASDDKAGRDEVLNRLTIECVRECIMAIETGAAVSKQKIGELKVRLLTLKEHL
jgi:hypothetical protein